MTPQEELAALRSSQKKPLTPIEELRQLRASQDRGSSLGMSRARSFDELLASTSGKDEQMFDYTTGAAGGLRAKISFGETPEEKRVDLKKDCRR